MAIKSDWSVELTHSGSIRQVRSLEAPYPSIHRIAIPSISVRQSSQGVYWQGKEKCCASSVLAFCPNLSAMGLDDLFTDHQSQAGSFVPRVSSARNLPVLFKYLADFITGDADSSVLDPRLDLVTAAADSAHLNIAAVVGEFQRVTEKVA